LSFQHPHSNTLFLTGATGFVGKVVLAELLRRKDELGVKRVFVLIRDKRGKTPLERFAAEIAPSKVFSGLAPGWTDLVSPMAGELTQAHAGLSEGDRATLAAEVTHVIHCAASVEFDLPIAEAAASNITSALNVVALAGSCPKLQRMIAVSTAYVTPWREHQGPIPEALSPLPFDAEAVYADILAGRADEMALMAASGHPNTYTLTKCISEHLVAARRGGVPVSIVRPSIVSATIARPFPGWLDSAAAFAGFVALTGAGFMRAMVVDRANLIDIVPCDVVSDVILDEVVQAPGDSALRVRHAAMGLARNVKIGDCIDIAISQFIDNPAVRKPGIEWTGPPGKEADRQEFFRHRLPATLSAMAARMTFQPKLAKQALRLADKLAYVNRAFPYFTHNRFDFTAAKPAEIPGFEAHSYIRTVAAGVDKHLLKRDPSATAIAGRAHRGKGDMRWVLGQPNGNWAIRLFGLVVRKSTRAITELITIDHPSFAAASAALPPGAAVVMVPTHRSYMDFLLCSFLFFAHPELKVRIPHIAAAEEFSAIPVLGWLFTKCQAFYLRRGVGREDPELTRTVHGLVAKDAVIEFFIEGARSRTRQFLRPRTGLVRCLQATGRDVAVLPIAITYDRVPHYVALARELAGDAKRRMSLRGLLKWAGAVRRGEISIGRVHIACAAPVTLRPTDDPVAVADSVMAGLQRESAASTYHLRTFLAHAAPEGVDLPWLKAALASRGGPVVDSALPVIPELSPVTEYSLRHQWLYRFYDDALARWADHPVVQHEARARRWLPATPRAVEADARWGAMLDALFGPLLKDVPVVLEKLGTPEWAPRYGTPTAMLADAPGVHVLNVQAVFDTLVAEGILERLADGKTHGWGPSAHQLDRFRARCQAAASRQTPVGAEPR
jgi:thioester reductase-like protein